MNHKTDDFTPPKKIPFQIVQDALLDTETTFAPLYLYRFSDLEAEEIRDLERIWPRIPVWRRKALMEDLEQLFGDDYLLSFESVCRLGLRDPQPEVRFLSVRSLFDYDVADLIPEFLRLMTEDEHADVRAAAASALGKYVYEGEIEELDPQLLRRIEDALLDVLQGSDSMQVRRRALEALGFSSRKEIPALIEEAFDTSHADWVVSALFAMGRSYDKRWREPVLEMLDHDSPDIRLEAARAAGEIELSEAREALIEMLEDDDINVRMAASWSLSQIGGSGVQQALTRQMEESDDPEEIDHLENAIDNLLFTEELSFFDIMDIPEDGLELDFDESEDLFD